jgi:hypothetical protein
MVTDVLECVEKNEFRSNTHETTDTVSFSSTTTNLNAPLFVRQRSPTCGQRTRTMWPLHFSCNIAPVCIINGLQCVAFLAAPKAVGNCQLNILRFAIFLYIIILQDAVISLKHEDPILGSDDETLGPVSLNRLTCEKVTVRSLQFLCKIHPVFLILSGHQKGLGTQVLETRYH